MNGFKCLITGCALLDERGMRWTRGDLYYHNNTYVFVAAMKGLDVAWIYDENIREDKPYIMVAREFEFLEKRGVIVMEEFYVSMNKVGRDYLKL